MTKPRRINVNDTVVCQYLDYAEILAFQHYISPTRYRGRVLSINKAGWCSVLWETGAVSPEVHLSELIHAE